MPVVTKQSDYFYDVDTNSQAPNVLAGATPLEIKNALYAASSNGNQSLQATDSIGSTYRVLSLPIDMFVDKVEYFVDSTTGAVVDIGVFWPTDYQSSINNASVAGTAVGTSGATFFASAVALVTNTNGSMVDVSGESAVYRSALRIQPLWQALGLSSKPFGLIGFDLKLTLKTAPTGTNTSDVFFRVMGSQFRNF